MSASTQRTSNPDPSSHRKLQSSGNLSAVYAGSTSRSTSVTSDTRHTVSQNSTTATSLSPSPHAKAPGASVVPSSKASTPPVFAPSKQPMPFDAQKWSASVRRQYLAVNTVACLEPVVAKFRLIVSQNPHWATSYTWEGISNVMQALSTLERVQKELWKKWCSRLYELYRTNAGIEASIARLVEMTGPFAACDKALKSAEVAALRTGCLQAARDMANSARQRLGLPLQPTARPAGNRSTPADTVVGRKRIKAWTVRCKKAFKACQTFTELGQRCLALEKEEKALQREHPDNRRPNYARDILWGEFSERKDQLTQCLGVPGNPNNGDPNWQWAPWHLHSSKPLDLSKATFAQPGAPARPGASPAGPVGSSAPSPSTHQSALAHSAHSSPVGIQNSSKSHSTGSTAILSSPAPTPGPDAEMYRGRHYPLIEEYYVA